ncbi:unnamed protein product, partial [marine sediment metagenome]
HETKKQADKKRPKIQGPQHICIHQKRNHVPHH